MRLRNPGTKKAPPAMERILPVIGIDIGQRRDPTAIAVVEIGFRPRESSKAGRSDDESHYVTRFLERLPLGTPYPEVARRLGEISERVADRCNQRPTVFVDATGVGQPVVDLLDESAHVHRLWAVYFTHGDRRTEDRKKQTVSLGKAHLVSRLQALLQCQRLHLPHTEEARVLAQELLDYEIRVDENANDKYGAFRVGTHDDLVTALGLAVQKEPRFVVYPGNATPYL